MSDIEATPAPEEDSPLIPNNPASNNDLKPNGGSKAWSVIIGAFFIWFHSWGQINAFGVFQAYYQRHLLPDCSPAAIAWIGSTQNFLVLFMGVVSGPLYDRGYSRLLLSAGCVFTVVGMAALSFVERDRFYQVYLSQGVAVGLGWGLMFAPAASLPVVYFSTKLPLAAGIASAGTGIGGIVYTVVFTQLEPKLGFPWTIRTLALIAAGTLLPSIFMMRTRSVPTVSRQLFDKTAFQELSYNAYLVAGVLTMTGLAVPYYYADLYAIKAGITDESLGFYVVAAINAGSFFGRIIPPMLSSLTGPFNMFVVCYFATGAFCLRLIACRSIGSVFPVAAFYGFFSGAIVALSPLPLIQMTPDRKLLGTRMGMAFAIPSFAVLLGSPISGAILSARGGFTYVWVFAGSCILSGALFMVVSRLAHAGLNSTRV